MNQRNFFAELKRRNVLRDRPLLRGERVVADFPPFLFRLREAVDGRDSDSPRQTNPAKAARDLSHKSVRFSPKPSEVSRVCVLEFVLE